MRARAPASRRRRWSRITHFMDRDGQFLASVSPRRFFCTQCHVPQNMVKPPVDNDFVDIDTLLSRADAGRTAMSAADRGRAAPIAGWRGSGISSSNCGTCCAGRARCSASACWCSRASSPASSSGAASTPRWKSPTPRSSAPAATRCATTCSQELKTTDPLLQPLRRARHLSGLPRAAQLDRQDRAQDAGLQGGLGPSVRHHQHAREIPRPPARAGAARMGAAEGQRLARMPQLPQRRVDGHHQADAARRRSRTSASCSPARRPASTATRASPTSCPT